MGKKQEKRTNSQLGWEGGAVEAPQGDDPELLPLDAELAPPWARKGCKKGGKWGLGTKKWEFEGDKGRRKERKIQQ